MSFNQNNYQKQCEEYISINEYMAKFFITLNV